MKPKKGKRTSPDITDEQAREIYLACIDNSPDTTMAQIGRDVAKLAYSRGFKAGSKTPRPKFVRVGPRKNLIYLVGLSPDEPLYIRKRRKK